MTEDDSAAWAQQRREAAASHAAAAERRRAAETERARAIVAAFVRDARAKGLPDGPLRARGYGGGPTYRTPLRGWYVRRDGSLGVDVDGNFYVLTAPRSLGARLRGVTVAPSDPPLVAGVGGRDGESMPLETLLQQRLDAGPEFP